MLLLVFKCIHYWIRRANLIKKATDSNAKGLPVVKRAKHSSWHEHLKRFGSTTGELKEMLLYVKCFCLY